MGIFIISKHVMVINWTEDTKASESSGLDIPE